MTTTPTYTITLYRTATCWMADLSRAEGADDVRRVMGTDQIPTPYTAAADPERVRRDVAQRNPNNVVHIYADPAEYAQEGR